ncbi:MAG TPA: hypothetical protein VFW03_14585, partial [Gemmatimonadaceae bacterium]|nr:hypothetical protein [Gemmatimonadaceae bacterium]
TPRVPGMELVVAFMSAALGLSAAFFLTIGTYDLFPDAWLKFGRWRQRALFGTASTARNPMIPRSIRQTPLD